jgi:D-alanine-D-alanine ligase
MDVGIAYDLRTDFPDANDGPEDRLEEYDSEATVEAIAQALRANGHTPRRLGGGRALLHEVLGHPPDLVFNIAEGFGTRSREAHVPSVLEMLRIPYTHSDPLTLALTLDKAMAKRVAASAGVPTPPFAVVERVAQAGEIGLRFPVIAKPLYEGSSMGIRNGSRLSDREALCACVEQLLADYGQAVLVEEFCPGPEFTVGVLGNGDQARPIGVMEIVPRTGHLHEFIYSVEVKRDYEQQVEYHVPPRRGDGVARQVEQVALGAYHALGCRDVARVDIRTDAEGMPRFLEVNPLPGLNPRSGDLVILSRKSGLPFETLIGRIVENARARCGL